MADYELNSTFHRKPCHCCDRYHQWHLLNIDNILIVYPKLGGSFMKTIKCVLESINCASHLINQAAFLVKDKKDFFKMLKAKNYASK
jgi:hypothetical protein